MTRADVTKTARWAVLLLAGASLTACVTPRYSGREGRGPGGALAQGSPVRPPANGSHGTMAPYQVGGIWYVPREQPDYDQTGIASWYGEQFNLKATANGEIFDLSQFSAAHTTLPLPSMVEVTNLDNGRKLVVRVNDRGPFVGGRLIDLSQAAARELGYERAGTAHVRVRYVGPAPLAGPEAGVRYAKASPAYPAPYSAPYSGSRPATVLTASAPMSSRAPSMAGPSGRRPADEEIFAETDTAFATAAPRALVAPPQPVMVASLAPTAVPRAAPRPAVVATAPSADDIRASVTSDPVFRIQAGAFGDPDNARRAADRLASVGTARIEPFQRDGVTFYRVTLPGAADEAEAYGVRDKVAAAGFADARVVKLP